jgi:hypothetical protein
MNVPPLQDVVPMDWQEEEPALEYVALAQVKHAVFAVLPKLGLKVLAEHFVGDEELEGQKWPTGH